MLRWVAPLLLVVLVPALGGCDSSAPDALNVAGNQIVSALEAYRADHGNYPLKLEELQPDYLADVPEANWGNREWHYTPSETQYGLHVCRGQDHYPCYYYSSKSKQWVFDH